MKIILIYIYPLWIRFNSHSICFIMKCSVLTFSLRQAYRLMPFGYDVTLDNSILKYLQKNKKRKKEINTMLQADKRFLNF